MERERFWELIGLVDLGALDEHDDARALEPLADALSPLSQLELESFYAHAANCLRSLDSPRIREKCHRGNSGEGFLYHRMYVIARGREFYEQMMAEPQQLTNHHQFDDMVYVLKDFDLFLAEQGI